MRTSQVTGLVIWRRISEKIEAAKEVAEARRAVEVAMGRGTATYKLLSEKLSVLKQELTELERTTYEVKIRNPFA